jgi:hypothetical protein
MHVTIMVQMSWAVSTRMAMMTKDAGKETSDAPAKLSWSTQGLLAVSGQAERLLSLPATITLPI